MFNNYSRLLCLAFGICLCPSGFLYAGITLENDTDDRVTVWLMGQGERKWRKPFTVKGRDSYYVDVPAGLYRIYTAQRDRNQDLGWNNFNNNKIRYTLVACAPCNPNGRPIDVVHSEVYHAAGLYICPKCGKEHTKWESGWNRADSEFAQGERNEHGAFRPDFNPEGPYRLGVHVLDANGGVVVAEALEDSPAKRMRRVDDDESEYGLTPGINVITQVNGGPIRNTTEFTAAVANSPQKMTVRVYNTERRSSRDYYTTLRY